MKKIKFKIDQEHYEELLQAQDGLCVICGAVDGGPSRHGTIIRRGRCVVFCACDATSGSGTSRTT